MDLKLAQSTAYMHYGKIKERKKED